MAALDAPELERMTKAQLQDYANEMGIEGVNSAKQTKAEMISTILG